MTGNASSWTPRLGELVPSFCLDKQIAGFQLTFLIQIVKRLSRKSGSSGHTYFQEIKRRQPWWTHTSPNWISISFLMIPNTEPLGISCFKTRKVCWERLHNRSQHTLQMTRSEYAFSAFCPGGRGGFFFARWKCFSRMVLFKTETFRIGILKPPIHYAMNKDLNFRFQFSEQPLKVRGRRKFLWTQQIQSPVKIEEPLI